MTACPGQKIDADGTVGGATRRSTKSGSCGKSLESHVHVGRPLKSLRVVSTLYVLAESETCCMVCTSTLPERSTTRLHILLGRRNRVGGIVRYLAADDFHRNFHRQKFDRTKECRERSVRRIATCSDANQTRLRRETRRSKIIYQRPFR